MLLRDLQESLEGIPLRDLSIPVPLRELQRFLKGFPSGWVSLPGSICMGSFKKSIRV